MFRFAISVYDDAIPYQAMNVYSVDVNAARCIARLLNPEWNEHVRLPDK